MGKISENFKVVFDYLLLSHFAVKIFKIRTTTNKPIQHDPAKARVA